MIREFKIEDINFVNELLKELNHSVNKESFNNDFLKILLYDDVNIKGVMVYQDLIDKLTIDYIVVDKLSRKEGIATKLLKYIEEKHKGMENITLEVRRSNTPALNFYKKNGFREAAIRKRYYKDEDAILMIKEFR